MERRRIEVDIVGQKVSLFSDSSQEKVDRVAELVNGVCEEIIAGTKSPLTHKTALLAAMIVTEKLVDLEDRYKSLRTSVISKAEGALALLNEVLPNQDAK